MSWLKKVFLFYLFSFLYRFISSKTLVIEVENRAQKNHFRKKFDSDFTGMKWECKDLYFFPSSLAWLMYWRFFFKKKLERQLECDGSPTIFMHVYLFVMWSGCVKTLYWWKDRRLGHIWESEIHLLLSLASIARWPKKESTSLIY